MSRTRQTTTTAAQTGALGRSMARTLKGGEAIFLLGDLGAGKTTFVKGLAKGLGVNATITSPTFVLLKVYPAKHKTITRLAHADCYRLLTDTLRRPGKGLLDTVGLSDYLHDPATVTVIEWAHGLQRIAHPTITVTFTLGKKPTERTITIARR